MANMIQKKINDYIYCIIIFFISLKKWMADTNDKVVDKTDDKQDQAWEKKDSADTIEFESLRKSNQEAQKLIKQFAKEKADWESKQKESENKDSEAKWEYEKLKSQRAIEKETKDKEILTTKEQLESHKTFIKELADRELSEIKEKLWKDFDDIVWLVWDLEDPLNVIKKIPLVRKFLVKDSKPTGDSWTPKGKSPDRLSELRTKMSKEWLTRLEQEEYKRLVFTNK